MQKKQALFIIKSPFQALCAIEAIKHYKIDESDFLCFDDEVVVKKTVPLIKSYGNIQFFHVVNLGTFQLMKQVRREIKKRYDTIFVGDYFSYSQYIIALFVAKIRAHIIYLDDGSSTISIAAPIFRKRGRSHNEKIAFFLFSSILWGKLINRSFFTIYDFKYGFPFPYEKNTFNSLVSVNNGLQHGAFVIGSNSSKMVLSDMSYVDYMKRLSNHIKKNYPGEKIYYCPHRADKNGYQDLLESLDWEIFNTINSVEIDFVLKGINPRFIVGFCSSALYTLKKIFPKTEIGNVRVNFVSENHNNRYRNIARYYEENGIHTIDFN